MKTSCVARSLTILGLLLLACETQAQGPRATLAFEAGAAPTTMRLTLEEAKERALSTSKLLAAGTANAESKAFAARAAKSDYFPKVVGSAMYFHFNDNLGTVLATQGRTVGIPGRPLLTLPPTTINVAVLNQDSSMVNVGVLQPITDLLKVRQGVRIARADEQIAQAEVGKGIRELAAGVEQLYWGLLAVQRIRAGAGDAVRGAEALARTRDLDARAAYVEAKQAVQDVDKQFADLQEKMNSLLDLPLDTKLELVEPPSPALPYRSAEDVIAIALVASPEIRAARQTICKVQAAIAAAKLDFVPSIALAGGYVNQTAASYVQQDIGYIGVVGSYTFVDWGKRKAVIRERQSLLTAATLKLQDTEDEVRQNARKAFRDVTEAQAALKTAGEMAQVRQQLQEKAAAAPEALRNPGPLLKASKDAMTAQVDFVKADLAYREAYVKLMALAGKQ